MANEIDTLMDLDPLELTTSDLDTIIAYHRRNRANAEGGVKPKKESGPKISLDNVLKTLVKPQAAASEFKRRV